MSQNSEQIEAKLCAYLEGELDEQGRAEIEKHLAANPAHRKLLAEVAGTRDLVRALPREAAPADLCETLQGQLERSVLLGDSADEQADSRMRIGRWRPILAIAAMVVLAVGLGLVIYFGLPSAATRQQHTYVVNSPSAGSTPGGGSAATMPAETAPETDAAGTTFADGGAAARRGMSIADAGGDASVSTPSTTTPTAGNAAGGSAVALSSAAPSVEVTGGAAPESLQSLAQRVPKLWSPEQQRALFYARGRGAAGGAEVPVGPAVYLVLSTPQPAAAREEVTQELDKLRVAWEAVPTNTVLAARDDADRGLTSNELAKALPEKKDTSGATAGGFPGGMRGGKAGLPGAAPGAAPAATAPAPEPRSTELADASQPRRPQPSSRPLAPAAPSVAAGAPGAPPTPDRLSADSFAATPSAPAASTGASPAPAPRVPELILARNVTRRQAEFLCTTLNARRPEQQVALWTAEGETPVAPAKLEVAQAPAVTEAEGVDTTQPAPHPTAGDETKLKSQVALGAEPKDGELRQRAVLRARETASGGAGGASGPGAGANTRAAGADASPQTTERLARRRVDEPSTGVASGVEDNGRVAEVDRGTPDRVTSGPVAQAKQGTVERTPARAMKTAPAPARQPAATTGGVRSGRESTAGKPATSGDADHRAEPDPSAATADKEASPPSRAAASPAPAPGPPVDVPASTTRSADTLAENAIANGEERVDLVIVVRSPESTRSESAAADAPPAAPSPAGPIEKYEILTVAVGDGDGTNVRVGEDGTIDLPPAGRIPAEGLTAEALGKRIAESIGRTNAGAKVTVTRPGAAGAATQPEDKAVEKDAGKGEPQPADPLERGDASQPEPTRQQNPPASGTSPAPADH